MGKLSPLLIPLPPLTTMLALPRSGRSDFDTDSPTHSALSKARTPSRVSTSTEEESTRSALSKQVGRIDSTFRLFPFGPGFATTFPKTLPAYMGRMKVFSSSISRMSVTGETSNRAAALGTTVLPNFDAVPTTTPQSSSTASRTAPATVSLSLSSMGTWKTFATPSGTLAGETPPTTSRWMSFPLFSLAAAVTVDRVPAGVDPSASRGSEMTRVEASIFWWWWCCCCCWRRFFAVAAFTTERLLEARSKIFAAVPCAARDIIIVVGINNSCGWFGNGGGTSKMVLHGCR
mmetsp:Transcript_27986/g.59948  ORF Transcript_27986/g.59948 Transcript_27986/m.59948 type:complete len:289 (-) Transcript_27986:239-1105(-)